MRLAHLEALRPVCPGCRGGPLRVSRVERGGVDELEEGLLECAGCRHEWPVIDGIPILVRDLRRMVPEQILAILARDDLSETTLGLLGEASGASSPLDSLRQTHSTYTGSHHERGSAGGAADEPALVQVLRRGLATLEAHGRATSGPVLDVGCAVGGSAFALAARAAERDDPAPIAAVDLNFGLLRIARRTQREGRVRYARRRSGLVYEERDLEAPVAAASRDRLGFWCADALALPFAPGTFGLVTSLNLIDCVSSPLEHLRSIGELLAPSGSALVATPFDWAPAATAPDAWLGGHSKRAEWESAAVVRSLVGGGHAQAIDTLRLLEHVSGLEWPLRLHDRSTMHYKLELFVLARA